MKISKGDILVKEYKEFIRSITPEEDAILIENTIREEFFDDGVEKSKKDIASNMINMKLPIETIMKATKLSKEEIIGLMNNQKEHLN